MNYSLPKKIRLCDDRLTEQLFKKGPKKSCGPITLKYLEGEEFQVGFGAPKKRFPKAVDRNYIKRKLRESFRLHYKIILGETPKGYGYFVFYGNINTSFDEIEKAMVDVLKQWKAL